MKNAWKLALPLALSLSVVSALADTVRGTIEKKGEDFFIRGNAVYKIRTSEKIRASLPSLESPIVTQSDGKKYNFEFRGSIASGEFILVEVPTKVSGLSKLRGVLRENNGTYSINGQKVKFGHSKVLNGYQFDELSKQSFVGKEVLAEGNAENETFVIDGMTPASVFSVEKSSAPGFVEGKLNEVGSKKFLLKEMAKNEFSQSADPFRVTVAGDKEEVSAGESAFIITMSGRQGDSFGAVNGHFAAGMGRVNDDLSLSAEVSNAYVTNEKDILSGNTSLTSYYFHLVQGQNNYRPTFTLVAYGVDMNVMKKFRDALEESHNEFRSKNVALTAMFNCTTETVKALKAVGIEGLYTQIDNTAKGVITAPLSIDALGDNANLISFSMRNDPSRYQPRAAYNSFVRAFLSDKFRKKHGIKRVDFIFTPQTPSKRPVGGIALGDIFQAPKFSKLEQKYELDQKLSPEALRPLLEEKLNKIK